MTEEATQKTTINPFKRNDSQANSVTDDDQTHNNTLFQRYDINNSNLLVSKDKTAMSTGRIVGMNRNKQ